MCVSVIQSHFGAIASLRNVFHALFHVVTTVVDVNHLRISPSLIRFRDDGGSPLNLLFVSRGSSHASMRKGSAGLGRVCERDV